MGGWNRYARVSRLACFAGCSAIARTYIKVPSNRSEAIHTDSFEPFEPAFIEPTHTECPKAYYLEMSGNVCLACLGSLWPWRTPPSAAGTTGTLWVGSYVHYLGTMHDVPIRDGSRTPPGFWWGEGVNGAEPL